jgi:site-specific recombinase XerD
MTQKMVRVVVGRAARKANLASGVHRLRHTFCSHLAMRGIPARTIQEMAGHQDLTTTMRCMHISPQSMDAAVLALDSPAPWGAEREAATA